MWVGQGFGFWGIHGLNLRHGGVDGVGGADAAEAAEGEVVVQDEDLLGVVEALDVLAGLGVVGAPERGQKLMLTQNLFIHFLE